MAMVEYSYIGYLCEKKHIGYDYLRDHLSLYRITRRYRHKETGSERQTDRKRKIKRER